MTTNPLTIITGKFSSLHYCSHFAAPDADRDGRPRKRRSRWGKEDVKINVPGLPTTLPSGLTQEQIDGYVIHMRLEEIHRKLQIKDYIPEERFVSLENSSVCNSS